MYAYNLIFYISFQPKKAMHEARKESMKVKRRKQTTTTKPSSSLHFGYHPVSFHVCFLLLLIKSFLY